jgi:hypothetical protein
MTNNISGAKATGPEMQHVCTNLFDFTWTITAAAVAGRMPRMQHYWLWLVDGLYDVCTGWLNQEHMPVVLQSWKRTDTSIPPITSRGIDWKLLAETNSQGLRSIEVSALRSEEDVNAVLRHPELVIVGDAAGIEKATGRALTALTAMCCHSPLCP